MDSKDYRNPEDLAEMSRTLSDGNIAKMFGVTNKAVSYFRKKFGIPTSRTSWGNSFARKYTIDHNFFSNIDTPNKAYILGLLITDGYVHKNLKSVSIAIKESDKFLLWNILRAMGSNSPIQTKSHSSGFNGGTLSVINLCSVELVKDLVALGVVPNKTFDTKYPSGIPNHLHRDLIRGLWDGDGSIYEKQFVLCGTLQLLESVRDVVLSHTGQYGNIVRDNSIFRIIYHRQQQPSLEWMYENSGLRLERKYQNYMMYWSRD